MDIGESEWIYWGTLRCASAYQEKRRGTREEALIIEDATRTLVCADIFASTHTRLLNNIVRETRAHSSYDRSSIRYTLSWLASVSFLERDGIPREMTRLPLLRKLVFSISSYLRPCSRHRLVKCTQTRRPGSVEFCSRSGGNALLIFRIFEKPRRVLPEDSKLDSHRVDPHKQIIYFAIYDQK